MTPATHKFAGTDAGTLSGTVTLKTVGLWTLTATDSVTATITGTSAQVTVDPDHDFDEALRLMATHRVRRLPVVDEDGKLVGIVAQADVAKHAQESETGEVVEKISK